MNIHISLALIIFIVIYGLFASEKMNKAVAVLLGASIYIIFHFIPFEEATKHIDVNVIFLLLGMMMIVKITEKSGVFGYVAVKAVKSVHADPKLFLILLFFLTAVFSAFLDNVTTVLLISPITMLIVSQMEISALPYIIVEILASNIGGTATLIGDPPNIMIGSAAKLSFADFLINLGPVILIISVVSILLLLFIFRKDLVVSDMNKERIMRMDEARMITDRGIMIKSLVVLGLVVLGFLFHGLFEVEPSIVALTGTCILLLWSKEDFEKTIEKIEWDTIFFFIGLFIMVGVLEYIGIIKGLADFMISLTGGDLKVTSTVLLFFSGIFSSLLNNIPLVATFIPIVKIVGQGANAMQLEPMWWSLALGACLGGNGTIVGASANVIMLGFAKKNKVPLSFGSYLKFGIPFTLISLIISYFYIILRYY